ncbi:hypothetical protein [Kingella sp. (in: b-proteobacteria)]|uniref:hypothetical protein n=1 Tax=Kingella sp. (in: b-proteobacteria) TaxID=2020713 RepID=UPI0026DDA2CA|nr:hypothetical protein [Kingella sp. (in: b-proteobacteria)]MDO4657162.1 hypothetical protein [Kingella sp. (in: b-proteobacteria)]
MGGWISDCLFILISIGSLKKQNRLVLRQTVFCWADWISGCRLSHHNRQPENPPPIFRLPISLYHHALITCKGNHHVLHQRQP